MPTPLDQVEARIPRERKLLILQQEVELIENTIYATVKRASIDKIVGDERALKANKQQIETLDKKREEYDKLIKELKKDEKH